MESDGSGDERRTRNFFGADDNIDLPAGGYDVHPDGSAPVPTAVPGGAMAFSQLDLNTLQSLCSMLSSEGSFTGVAAANRGMAPPDPAYAAMTAAGSGLHAPDLRHGGMAPPHSGLAAPVQPYRGMAPTPITGYTQPPPGYGTQYGGVPNPAAFHYDGQGGGMGAASMGGPSTAARRDKGKAVASSSRGSGSRQRRSADARPAYTSYDSRSGGGSRTRRPPRQTVPRVLFSQCDFDGYAGDDYEDDVQEISPESFEARDARADWTLEDVETLIDCWIIQVDAKERGKDNKMSRSGWNKLHAMFNLRTGHNYTKKQLGYKVGQLRNQYLFKKKWANNTAIGREADGTPIAPDWWWAQNTKGKPECAQLRNGYPRYMPSLDRMWEGVAVTGTTSLVATPTNTPSTEQVNRAYDGEGDIPGYNPSVGDVDDAMDDQGQHIAQEGPGLQDTPTPSSRSSKKRGSSTSTTGTSPNKKYKNPATRLMASFMQGNSAMQQASSAQVQQSLEQKQDWLQFLREKEARREEVSRRHLEIKSKREDDRIAAIQRLQEEKKMKELERLDRVLAAAEESGINAETHPELWSKVLLVAKSDMDSDWFVRTVPRGRAAALKYYKRVDTTS